MILILSMLWVWVCLSRVECTEDTAVGNMTKNMLQKDKVLLLHMLWQEHKILLLSWFFQDKFRDKELFLRTSMIYVTIFQLIVVFVSLPSFNLPVELVLCLLSYCSIDRHLVFFCLLFEYMWWQSSHTANLYWPYSLIYQAINYGHDTMQKILPIAY